MTDAAYCNDIKDDLKNRLRRIEGQLRGVERMLDEDREVREVMQQLTAARAALQKAVLVYAQSYAKDCLLGEPDDQRAREAVIDDLIAMLAKAS